MRYHNITKDDMLNGEGLRVVLWVSGCAHACPGCHNRITWDPEGGLSFDEAAKMELFEQLEQDYIAGITFSGGDPLFPGNRNDVEKLMGEIKEKYPNKNIWLYTGYTFEQIKDLKLLRYVDVLVDGRFVENLKDTQLHWCGSSNQKIIDVQETLKLGRVVLHNV